MNNAFDKHPLPVMIHNRLYHIWRHALEFLEDFLGSHSIFLSLLVMTLIIVEKDIFLAVLRQRMVYIELSWRILCLLVLRIWTIEGVLEGSHIKELLS